MDKFTIIRGTYSGLEIKQIFTNIPEEFVISRIKDGQIDTHCYIINLSTGITKPIIDYITEKL